MNDINLPNRPLNSHENGSHTFHIPVMGSGFTIDTPIKVAKYGISSAISLVDDRMIEQVRKFHSESNNLPYEKIGENGDDFRARRITAYLNLVKDIVDKQVELLINSDFEPSSEITRYFTLLPESKLKSSYEAMMAAPDSESKEKLKNELRQNISVGSIDVNIMTKLDRDRFKKGEKLPPRYSDALTALRGFAQSKLDSAIVFSAGLNRRLFTHLSEFEDFFPNIEGVLKKKIILKVSDFRSACIQSKFLAKKGLWTSEFRVESGLNCGGHAFATQGHLMGSILNEFKLNRDNLLNELSETYMKALTKLGLSKPKVPQRFKLTVQGGIGTKEESDFLYENYEVDGTGWGTPFLLVPEVSNIDPDHLQKLVQATDDDIELSEVSPLGVPFWSLKTSSSEITRLNRIADGRPGSPCPKGYLTSDTEFTDVPICRASRGYQRKKIAQIEKSESIKDQALAIEAVTNKACICHDLSGGVAYNFNLDQKATTAVCCGPNIVNFSSISTLEEMVGHIYGRISLITNSNRSHMFIAELSLYVDHLSSEIKKSSQEVVGKTSQSFLDFKKNLIDGIEHYQTLAEKMTENQREQFELQLKALHERIEAMFPESQISFA